MSKHFIPTFALALVASACSTQSDDRSRGDNANSERIAATPELAALGVQTWIYADESESRALLFDAKGVLVASVQSELQDDRLFAEAVLGETSYVIEGTATRQSFVVDGNEVLAVDLADVDAGRDLGQLPDDRLHGFQLISAAAPLLLPTPRAGVAPVADGDLVAPDDPEASGGTCYIGSSQGSIVNGTQKSATVFGWLYFPKSVLCEQATQNLNNSCTNQYCWGCNSITGCDGACVGGDYLCVGATARGYACDCYVPPGGGGGDGGGEGGGGGSGGGGGCTSDWQCGPTQECCWWSGQCSYWGCC